MLFSTVLALSLALAGHATPTGIARADVDKSDWKYAVGWDGVTLPSDAIGTSVATTNETSHLEKRTVGGVYICTDTNWKGVCGYAVQPLNKCIALGVDWEFQISSFGPDQCTTCLAFGTRNCEFTDAAGDFHPSWQFRYPGDSSGGLGTSAVWNDQIGSFICSKSC